MVASNRDDIDPVDIIIAGRDTRTYVRTRKRGRRHLAPLHPPANCHLNVGTTRTHARHGKVTRKRGGLPCF